MGTVISELFDESGMSVQAFADKAGLKYGTAYDIAKGVSKVENIGAGAFVRIAHVFGKTADELLSDMPNHDIQQNLSAGEQALLEMYRKCNDVGKMGIEDFARAVAKQFPADGFTLNLDFIGEEDETARSEKIARFYNDARARGMTDEQLIEMLDSLTSLISKASTGALPKKNAVEVIYNSMMS